MDSRPQKLTAGVDGAHDTNPIIQMDPFLGSQLQNFLDHRRVVTGKGSAVSMTGLGSHKGSWFVGDEDYEKFLTLMHDYLFVRKLRPNNFNEQRRPDGVAPLLVDLDFR